MEDGSKPALHEGATLLPEQLSTLDVEVSLVHDDQAERVFTCCMKQGFERVGVVDKKLGGRNMKLVS